MLCYVMVWSSLISGSPDSTSPHEEYTVIDKLGSWSFAAASRVTVFNPCDSSCSMPSLFMQLS